MCQTIHQNNYMKAYFKLLPQKVGEKSSESRLYDVNELMAFLQKALEAEQAGVKPKKLRIFTYKQTENFSANNFMDEIVLDFQS